MKRGILVCLLSSISGMGLALETPDKGSLQRGAARELHCSEREQLRTDDQQVLRESAQKELKLAIEVVTTAEREGALWIPARNALAMAKMAFALENYQESIAQARLAFRLATLGIEQLDSPPYRHF